MPDATRDSTSLIQFSLRQLLFFVALVPLFCGIRAVAFESGALGYWFYSPIIFAAATGCYCGFVARCARRRAMQSALNAVFIGAVVCSLPSIAVPIELAVMLHPGFFDWRDVLDLGGLVMMVFMYVVGSAIICLAIAFCWCLRVTGRGSEFRATAPLVVQSASTTRSPTSDVE